MDTGGAITLVGATVVTMNSRREILVPGYVTYAGGEIVESGAGRPESPAGTVWDVSGRIVLPGFVNTHAHLVSSLTRGLGGDRFLTGGVAGGRERMLAIRESLDGEMAYAGTRLALIELMLSGVTTTTESYAARRGLEDGPDGALEAWTESGMRGTFYRASVDRTEIVPGHRHDSAAVAHEELDRLSRAWNSDLLTVGAEAMALHRVSRELFDAVNGWAAETASPFAMHVSYVEDAAEYSVKEYGSRLLTLLDEWGALDGRFLGHHPIWVDDDEIRALAASGAGVSVCSPANMLIGLDPAPLAALIDAGVRVGLGTDQPNDGHNFFEVTKTTLLQQRAAARSTEFGSPELMLELATIGGAKALHLEDRVGSIEPGKQADLVILDAGSPALAPATARISNIVYAASPADVEAVVVAGRIVVRDGKPTMWDIEDVAGEAHRAVAAALDSAGLDTIPLTEWPVVAGPESTEETEPAG